MTYAIPAGKNPPEDLFAVIEVPQHASPVKYELDKDSELLMVDRFIATSMSYPMNYGFIPSTLGKDGDPLDILVPTPFPVQSGAALRVRVVGVLLMEDEKGSDAKIIAVPHAKLTSLYDHVHEAKDLGPLPLSQIKHFFEHYKDLEAGKWVKVEGFGNKAQALDIVKEALKG